MSPTDCSAEPDVSSVVNPSARVYRLDTVPDVDADADGFIDGTESYVDDDADPLTPDVLTGTPVDLIKGWTCFDLPAGDTGAHAWNLP